MFSRHVSNRLSAYCNGETPADETHRIAGHLASCARCRKEFEKIRLGVLLAKQLPLVSAPDEIWTQIQTSLSKRPASNSQRSFPRASLGSFRLLAAAALFIAAVSAGVIWWQVYRQPTQPISAVGPNRQPGTSWQVEALSGSVKIGKESIAEKGRIGVGDSLETNGQSRALITVGNIGHVEVEPNSHVRLIDARATVHRLALDRGTINAQVSAPPRLFFVDTPSAEAADLGCAYTLQVDDQGRSFLRVTLGWVSLSNGGLESFVPRGAACQTRPGIGPGTPYFEDASAQFIDALEKLDFEGGDNYALAIILTDARDRDTFTLWHLLPKVGETQRRAVVDRIAALVRLPTGVTRAGLMRLDKQMLDLDLWLDAMDTVWF